MIRLIEINGPILQNRPQINMKQNHLQIWKSKPLTIGIRIDFPRSLHNHNFDDNTHAYFENQHQTIQKMLKKQKKTFMNGLEFYRRFLFQFVMQESTEKCLQSVHKN
jgi:hypothetical protein